MPLGCDLAIIVSLLLFQHYLYVSICVCPVKRLIVQTPGNFEVGVHIADVSYFVEEGNALDAIASRRATSVYMVQKVSFPLTGHTLPHIHHVHPHCSQPCTVTVNLHRSYQPRGSLKK